MRIQPFIRIAICCFALTAAARAQDASQPKPASGEHERRKTPRTDQSFFNGKDLKGWKGDEAFWSVKDGTIVGHSDEPVEGNKFIWSEVPVSEFYLSVDVKLTPAKRNAGIQFRSVSINERGQARGYASGLKLILRSTGWMGLGSCPVRFEGDEGWVETGDTGRVAVSLDSLRADLPAPTIRGGMPTLHTRNFLDCVKSRGRTTTNEDIMRSSHIACHAAAIAWKLNRKLTFDPDTETFVGDDEANRMRSRAARQPWAV